MPQVCFDSSAFYTVMLIGLGTILYVIYTTARLHEDARDKLRRGKNRPTEHQPVNKDWIQQQEDLRRIYHPLTPPLRRGPFSFPGSTVQFPVNTPTRGEYGNFQQLGFIINTADVEQAMPLIGRRIHSNQYEYYTFHHYNPQIKIPIKITGDREIQDGDSITVPGYATPLQVKLYDIDAPRYIPY